VAVRLRITTYEQAFEGLLGIPFDDKLKNFVKKLEEEGHTEKSISFSIWKKQDKLRVFRNDPRFLSVLKNEIEKWSWKKDDPRWVEYWKRKEEERRAAALRQELEQIKSEKQLEGMLDKTTKSKRKPGGYIYFIQGQCGGAIKIGYSKNPELRLKELQTGYPDTLVMLLMVPGNEHDEAVFHKMFKESRLRGEWFKPDPYLIDKIKELKEKFGQ